MLFHKKIILITVVLTSVICIASCIITHVLFADMMIDNNSELLKFSVPESYIVERFNIYNLITDNYSYTESDYTAIVEQIKNYLKGTYKNIFLWRMFNIT